MVAALYFLASVATGSALSAFPCSFSFPDAFVAYDLSSLSSQIASWTDGTFSASFSFCQNIPNVYCGSGLVRSSSSFGLSGQETCSQSYGSSASATATLLARATAVTGGISLLYPTGEQCGPTQGETYNTILNLECAPGAPLTVVSRSTSPSSPDDCEIVVELRADAGCGALVRGAAPPRPLNGGIVAFLVVLGLGALYCGGGALYKRRVLGARGLESLPNIEFWRSAAEVVRKAVAWLTCGRLGAYAEEPDDYAGLVDKDDALRVI